MLEKFYEGWLQVSIRLRSQWRWLGFVLVIGSFAYMLLVIGYNREQLFELPWQEYGWASLATLGIYLVSLLPQYLTWARMMSRYHQPGWKDVTIFFQGMVMRRLPGGIWHWVGRTTLYSATTNVPGRAIMLANFLEWLMMMLVAGAMISLGLPGIVLALRIALALIFLGAAIGLSINWQSSSLLWWKRLLEALLWVLLYLLAWSAGGVVIYVYGQASDVSNLTLVRATWIWAVTGGLTWLIIIIPSGLGVRELSLSLLLGSYMPVSSALIISLLIRFVFLIADILWGGLGWWLGNWMIHRTQPAVETIP